MASVLDGVRVLEFGTFITGPCAGIMLANLGADVVKIERPKTGDPFRNYGGRLYGWSYQGYNANKRSITVDLKNPEGIAIIHRLAKTADVVIENYRPGVTDELGIGYAKLKEINPRIIYCAITGFGPDGPYRHRPTYDTVAQAMGGMFSQFLDAENPRIVGPAMGDALSGIYSSYGILGALYERERTGKGRRIDVPMIDAVINFIAEPFSELLATGHARAPRERPRMSQSYALPCADGKIIGIHLASPQKFWEAMLAVIGKSELKDDPRFQELAGRIENYDAIDELFRSAFIAQPSDHWFELLEANDVPHAPIYTLDAVKEDPQVRHLDTFYEMEHPTEGKVGGIKRPVFYDGDREIDYRPPPTLGEQTDEILREAGYDDDDIAAFHAGAVV